MFNIIKRDVLSLLRDKGSLFFVIIFPSLLVFILGNMLAQMDNSDEAINPITMEYAVEANDFFDLMAIQSLASGMEDNDSISMVKAESFDQAKLKVDDNTLSAAVLFSDPMAVNIYEGYDQIQNRAITSVFQGFTRQVAALKAIAEVSPQNMLSATAIPEGEFVVKKEFGYSRSMLDYYAVAMLTMIIFMGGSIGAASNLYESRKDGTLRRMLASPKNRVNTYIQTVFGAVPQCIVQVVCVMLTSVLLFGAHYADTMFDNILLFAMFFLVGLTVNAVFLVIGMFIKVNPTLVIMPLMWAIMFISGTFSKEIQIEGITEYSPIWQIQNASFDLTVFGNYEKCLMVMLISVVVFIGATAIGALLFKRKDAAIS